MDFPSGDQTGLKSFVFVLVRGEGGSTPICLM